MDRKVSGRKEERKKVLMEEKRMMLKLADLMAQNQLIDPDEKAKLITLIRREGRLG